MNPNEAPNIKERFRGFCPIIVDVETSGLDPKKHALLELAAVSLRIDGNGCVHPDKTAHWHVLPFEDAKFDDEAMRIHGIKPHHPFRFAVPESQAIQELCSFVKNSNKAHHCQRAVLVGHNAWFDLHMMQAAFSRVGEKKSPFHLFTCFDTATLAGFCLGQTVLSKALHAAGIAYHAEQAHSAQYDAQVTARLFCALVNRWKELGGWPA